MRYIKTLATLFLFFVITGCMANDSMDNISIHTTAYPIEYVTERLYGNHSKIKSIYPNGSVQGEIVSDKLLRDYSKTNLFIFNGLDPNEKDYVYKMLGYNKKLKIIDVSTSVVYENKVEELWLDPMNLLTIANNIKKGFEEYITSTYLLNEIRDNYEVLKQELISLDADYHETANRANRKVIVISDDRFMYLSRYGIEVISLEENEHLTQKTIHTVNEKITSGEIKCIFVVKGHEVNNTVKNIQENTKIELIELHDLYKLTEEEFSREETYFTIMRDNLELLKIQLYN